MRKIWGRRSDVDADSGTAMVSAQCRHAGHVDHWRSIEDVAAGKHELQIGEIGGDREQMMTGLVAILGHESKCAAL